MDSTRSPLAVVTMVHGDYFFLKRWYDYYSAQVGAENLYIFSHGNDPRHRQIAPDANVMALPRDATMYRFDRRRWRMLSLFVSGMMQFYNWVILGDVDEVVIVDPRAAPGILPYMQARYWNPETAPKNIAPLCLEIVHYPQDETLPIEEGRTILSRRRTFRPNRNYSKPCLVRSEVLYRAGGHLNNLSQRHLPDDMYLLHLKYFDLGTIGNRSDQRTDTILSAPDVKANFANMASWNDANGTHRAILERSVLAGEDIELKEFRAQMLKQKKKGPDRFVYGYFTTNNLYRIPERFAQVF